MRVVSAASMAATSWSDMAVMGEEGRGEESDNVELYKLAIPA